MTPESARTSANLLLAIAGGAVMFAVLRTPRWRRAAGRLIWSGLITALPRAVASETREAWSASGHRP